KTLYFLFALYGASFGKLHVSPEMENKDGVFEGSNEQPFEKYLFPDKFEAWQFGPVNRDVYRKNLKNEITTKDSAVESSNDIEVKEFISEVIAILDEMGDFELVDRTHKDEAWKSKVTDKSMWPKEMDPDTIIKGYEDAIQGI